MTEQPCRCGSGKPFSECCEPVITGARPARTPEELMRARFTAHCLRDYPFLVDSIHPEHREDITEESISQWASLLEWEGLEVHGATPGATDDEGEVSFTARYTVRGIPQELREDASFSRVNGEWKYVDGYVHKEQPLERESPKVGRNDPCPCGSGKKHKKCCMKNTAPAAE